MNPLRVMIVEDERVVAWEIEERLSHMGCQVCASVPSGEAALAAADASKPDLVLMDIMLEGDMDGIAAATALRKRHQTAVIFCSAYSGEVRKRAEATSPLGFLEKPLNYEHLSQMLFHLQQASGTA